MRGLVALAGIAAAQAGFGFTSGYASEQKPWPGSWSAYVGEVCDGYNILPYAHPKKGVSEASCYAKCEAGDAGACTHDATQDSALICLPVEDCADLCWSLDECQSIDATGSLCYLNTWDCAPIITSDHLTPAAGYTLYAKQVPWQAECGGSMTADVVGGDYGVDSIVNGMPMDYVPSETDVDVFIRSDGLFRLKWQGGECSWVLQKAEVSDVDPKSMCADDVDAANFLFGLASSVPSDKTLPGYDEHICARGKVAGYCSTALFEGVCPATCGFADLDVCWGDNHAAAAVLADAWSVGATGCDLCAVKAENGDEVSEYDPVVQSICKTTCGTVGDASLSVPEAGVRRLTAFAQLEATGRMLDGHDDFTEWEDYFWSSGPGPEPARLWTEWQAAPVCDEGTTRELSFLTDKTWCDVQRFENPIPGLAMEEVCPQRVLYQTNEGKYCPFQNVLQSKVDEYRCVTKCPNAADPGCEGTDSLLLPDSDALCLPREECEELCTSLAGCMGIDMHKRLPRCYLNAVCDPEIVQEDGNYQLLIKVNASMGFLTTTGKYCPATNVDPRATAHGAPVPRQVLAKQRRLHGH
jgi:hypothetical protein